jgi:hypothetical protein
MKFGLLSGNASGIVTGFFKTKYLGSDLKKGWFLTLF